MNSYNTVIFLETTIICSLSTLNLKFAKEIGFRAGEGGAYGDLGIPYDSLVHYQFEIAGDNFGCAVEAFNAVRSFWKSKDDWKTNFRELYETTNTFLWLGLVERRL